MSSITKRVWNKCSLPTQRTECGADSISWLLFGNVAHDEDDKKEFVRDFHRLARLGFRSINSTKDGVTVHNGSNLSLLSMWNPGKVSTRYWLGWRNRCLRNCCGFLLRGDDVLRYQGCLCIPNVDNSIVNILLESQSSRHCFHPGSTKIYCDLEEVYWCIGTKKDITGLVFKCPDYNQVNLEDQNTRYFPQDISIPTWK